MYIRVWSYSKPFTCNHSDGLKKTHYCKINALFILLRTYITYIKHFSSLFNELNILFKLRRNFFGIVIIGSYVPNTDKRRRAVESSMSMDSVDRTRKSNKICIN